MMDKLLKLFGLYRMRVITPRLSSGAEMRGWNIPEGITIRIPNGYEDVKITDNSLPSFPQCGETK